MQTVIHGYREGAADEAPVRLVLSVEVIAYVSLIAFALVFRLAELNSVPLQAREAERALAAWNLVQPAAPGEATGATSPLLFVGQALTFSVLGASEFSARVLTALAGVGVILAPLLFRPWLGRARAFLFSLLLTFSPVLLLASRESSPVVWSVLLAALTGWAALKFGQTRREVYSVAAVVFGAALLLLSEPGSIVLALTLVAAALLTRALAGGEQEGEPATTEPAPRVSWQTGLAVAALVVVLVSTVFMTYPAGMSHIGALLEASARGLTTPQAGTPPVYPLLMSAFYEPFLWLFGVVGLVLTLRREMRFTDRFLAIWLLLASIASLLFVGASAAHALWLTIPLVGLSTRAVTAALYEDDRRIWDFPWWARWLVAAVSVALLAGFSVALQAVARSLAEAAPLNGAYGIEQVDPVGLILVAMALMFFVVGFFLASSVWDRTTALRGAALGFLLFGAVTSLGAGWNAAVPNFERASEPWHLQATTGDAALLRQTLLDVAQRESRGFPTFPLYTTLADDPVVAWLLRDFADVNPITTDAEASGQPVVLLPDVGEDARQPALGGNYVGQDFVVQRFFRVSDVSSSQALAWWLHRETMREGAPLQTVVLWLRSDVFQGVEE